MSPVAENKTLLIVDDEPETLQGYAEFLTPRQGAPARRSSRGTQGGGAPATGPSQGEIYNLLLAKSGEEALALVRSELAAGRRVAAGFFDVKLGEGMDGLATIAAIQRPGQGSALRGRDRLPRPDRRGDQPALWRGVQGSVGLSQ